VSRRTSGYPANIELFFGEESPETVSIISGEANLCACKKTALFCSSKCPGDAILKTYDLAQRLPAEGETVISGLSFPV